VDIMVAHWAPIWRMIDRFYERQYLGNSFLLLQLS
jgi:hypothetical protein